MTPTRDEIIEGLMSKAQEFASSWSLVGGRFDDGSMIVEAEARKEELRAMLRALRDQREADARDAARYRVIREELNDNIEFLRSSDDPEAIDEICDEIIQSAMSAQGEKS